jgi:hypothetical protein
MPQQIDRHTLSLILSERTGALDLDSFSPPDWELLLQRAQEEGVAPLAYRALSKSGMPASMPESVHSRLRAMYVSLRMNNEALLRELENLIRQFDRADIPAVALKGICFALTIYPEIGLRPMGDLDLLAPASRAPDALRIAREAGYAEILPEAFPGIDGLLGHAVALQKSAAPFAMLELHHTLVAEKSFAYAVPVDWFWTQTEPLQAISPGRDLNSLLMLSPTAQVLYASAHAMLQHGGRNTNLRWYYDLDRLIRVYAERMDWDLLLEQARKFEWGSAVYAALSKAIGYFDTPVPGDVLAELAASSDKNQELIAIYQEMPETRTQEEYQKWMSLNWRGRIRMALGLVFPSPAYMRWRYNLKSSWWVPAYYLYRWWGILRDTLYTVVLSVRNLVFHAGLYQQ